MKKPSIIYIAVLVMVAIFFLVSLPNDIVALEGDRVTVTASRLNVRIGPGTQYWRFDLVDNGTSLQVLAQQGDWQLVKLSDGRTGWVHGRYTKGSPDGSLSLEGIGKLEVTASSLNIRLGPSTSYTAFDQLPQGTQATILAENNGWLLLKMNYHSTGWVHSRYTRTLSEPEENEPKVEVTVTASSGLNVRHGPGLSNSVITVAASGSTLMVAGEEGQWLRVLYDGENSGWVHGDYTTPTSSLPSRGERNQLLAGRTIVIDPGHGGRDPGAVGVTGLQEKVVNMETSQKVASYLRSHGARVVLTRSSDYFVSLAQRVNIAHNSGADIFVSIHANAHPNPGISGTETYYNSAYQSWNSRNLANLVQQELVGHSGLRNIGVKHANFYVIRNTRIPSILVELAFLSNWHDESLLRRDSFLDGQAQAITWGIINYFN